MGCCRWFVYVCCVYVGQWVARYLHAIATYILVSNCISVNVSGGASICVCTGIGYIIGVCRYGCRRIIIRIRLIY